MASQKKDVTFDIDNGSYKDFISDLRKALAAGSEQSVKGHPVLPAQTNYDEEPRWWVHVHLKSKDGAAPTVAIRSDNAYILGFKNIKNMWFQLAIKNTNGKMTNKIIIKDARRLQFGGDYKDLVGRDPKEGLPKLKLGKHNTLNAAAVLWKYGEDNNDSLRKDPLEPLKTALATLAVTLCEAARLTPIYNTVSGGWAKVTSITPDQVTSYINNWGKLSTALLDWDSRRKQKDKDPEKTDSECFEDFNSIGIHNSKDALGVVELLLNRPPKKKSGLLAWLNYLWGLLVAKTPQLQQEETTCQKPEPEKKRQKPKTSSMINPLY